MPKYTQKSKRTDTTTVLEQGLDITAPEHGVEIEVQDKPSGRVLYVHVDGQTVLRICRITQNIRFTVPKDYNFWRA